MMRTGEQMEREKILTGNYKRAFAAVRTVIFAAVMLLLIPIVRKTFKRRSQP